MRKLSLRAIAVFLAATICLVFQASYAVKIDQIVVFGDSMSDNGNILSLTRKAHKVFPSVPVLPKDPPYYMGRFSNGPVWIEDLAAALNVPLIDYAYGGAWAEPLHDSRIMVPFGIGMQVNFYLVRYALDFHKGDHLFVIWAGANDYVDGRDDADYATSNTVASIETQIDWLVYYGAKNILVLNLPDLSVVPEITKKGQQEIQKAKKIVNMHNDKLARMMAINQDKYRQQDPDIKLIFADIGPDFMDVYNNPEKYNLKDVTTPCYTGDYSLKSLAINKELTAAKEHANLDIMQSASLRVAYMNGRLFEDGQQSMCDAPDEHLFWDQIHPTRIMHNLMSMTASTILANNGIEGQRVAKRTS